jgi:3',5'-cyclic AMP phosphodiesterase CpdA
MPDAASGPRRGRRLFGFAVIADSHLEPEAGISVPRSNARNRTVVDWLRPLAPRFVLHLGDIVHPVPDAPGHDETLVLGRSLYAPLACPVLYTPGNHDIGDKRSDAAPASSVTEQWLSSYGRVFGPQFGAHHAGDCSVFLFNSCILNAGFAIEAEQRRWLEAELAAARGRRVFLATHYPPYLLSPDESSHYDQIDTPARFWLLELLRRHSVEAMFCGHVHNFFWNRLDRTDIYVLPSPSFVRRDYSEMSRGEPPDEFGRNDTGKLGFFWVDVYEHGHVARFVRTFGATGAMTDPVVPAHPNDPGETPIGLWLRHPWCELTELPHNPPVDEFARRKVRNDYPVQALWDFGVRALRAPIDDLLEPRVRARVAELCALGHRFTFFSMGLPDDALLAALRTHAALVARWECVLPARMAGELAERVRDLVRETGLSLAFACLRSGAEGNTAKAPGKHFAAPGFSVSELEDARQAAHGPLRGVASALCFSLARTEPLERSLEALGRLAAETGMAVVASRSMTPAGPNDTALDDAANRAFVEESVAAAIRHPRVELFLDTFMDVDRGYYVRSGLIDRSANWRPAGEALARLAASRRQA